MIDRVTIWGFFAALAMLTAVLAIIHRQPHAKTYPRVDILQLAESSIPETPRAPKADKIKVTPQLDVEVHQVKTIAVRPLFDQPPPRFEPAPVLVQTEFPSLPKLPVKADKPDKGDICAKHGMHREAYDNGKRWRCKK